ncbi:MAG: hypothetical protein SF339_06445 [Blastocatellia bacterium]|nr:hypothetical protein [Blastocatellia bacterium]
MYQRPRFLEELQAIREEMARECDYDLDLFAEMIRSNKPPQHGRARNIRGFRQFAPLPEPPDAQPPTNRSTRKKR